MPSTFIILFRGLIIVPTTTLSGSLNLEGLAPRRTTKYSASKCNGWYSIILEQQTNL
jgi:hypothetical protein